MSKYLKDFFHGTEILFGNNKKNKRRETKRIDIKKELRIAKHIRKTSVSERSSNRIRKIVTEALS